MNFILYLIGSVRGTLFPQVKSQFFYGRRNYCREIENIIKPTSMVRVNEFIVVEPYCIANLYRHCHWEQE